MEVRHVAETEEGQVVFQAVLEGPELMLVLETGLNVLMKEGILPFLSTDSVDPINIMDLSEEMQ